MAPTKPQIPFPGPNRPYKESEQIFFFGRDREVMEIKNRLRKHRVVVLTSLPRSGKTSMLRCGLAPKLRLRGFPAKAGNQWKVVFVRPHLQPFRNLAAALSRYEVLYDHKVSPSFQEELELRLQRDKNTLIDLYLQSNYARKFNYLLIVDPVDELRKGRVSDLEKRLFIEILLRAAQHPEANIYLVLSVSSKMLNSEDLPPELREIIDGHAYFLNTLSQVDLEQAIRRPVEAFGYAIEDDFCNLLIDKYSFDSEQLPKLQEAMMGAWMIWEKEGQSGPIGMKHYSKAGGNKDVRARMKIEDPDAQKPGQEKLVLKKDKEDKKISIGGKGGAKSPLLQKIQAKKSNEDQEEPIDSRPIEEIAESIFLSLAPSDQRLIIRVFKSLVFINPGDSEPKMRALELQGLADILGKGLTDSAQIISKFDKGQYTILHLTGSDDAPDTVVSIGIPEIIQTWDRLEDWLMEEQQDLAIYREIVQSAELYFIEDDTTALWDGEILEEALNWRDNKKLNENWAALYETQNNFPLAMQFLKESYENSQLSGADTSKSKTVVSSASPTKEKVQETPPPPTAEEKAPKRPKIKIKPKK